MSVHGSPLKYVELPDLEPVGTKVVVAVTHCGVCRSDLYLWHGGYDLGGGRMLLVKDRGLVLPAAPGHEIVGRVVRLGPDATGVSPGDRRVVCPWIGGGELTLSVAGTIFRAHTIQDSLTGSIQELREVLDLAQEGRLAPTPIVEMPRHLANAAMASLERGQITGRVVLVGPEAAFTA